MKEPITNIGSIHRQCAINRRNTWQENNPDTVIDIDDYCKIEFKEGNLSEYMFVQVKKIEVSPAGIRYTGLLANDPYRIKNIKCDDEVSFCYNEICQLEKGSHL